MGRRVSDPNKEEGGKEKWEEALFKPCQLYFLHLCFSLLRLVCKELVPGPGGKTAYSLVFEGS
jgi:hypothetical protein